MGGISFLVAIGYVSTPDKSTEGKVAFSFVLVMIGGMVMKVLHLAGANGLIVVGLAGIAIAYILDYLRHLKR